MRRDEALGILQNLAKGLEELTGLSPELNTPDKVRFYLSVKMAKELVYSITPFKAKLDPEFLNKEYLGRLWGVETFIDSSLADDEFKATAREGSDGEVK